MSARREDQFPLYQLMAKSSKTKNTKRSVKVKGLPTGEERLGRTRAQKLSRDVLLRASATSILPFLLPKTREATIKEVSSTLAPSRLISKAKRCVTVKVALLDEKEASARKIRRDSEFGLSSEFWAHFVENYWCQRPSVFKGIIASPLTPEEVFREMVNVGEQYRANAKTHLVRFYVEHALQRADIGKHLPEAGDRSVEGYARRIKRKLGGRRFGLVINDFHKYNADLYLRMRDFLRGLYEFVNIPANPASVALFLGNYKSTPFGLHHDGEVGNNFTFMVAGRKKLLAWPRESFNDHRNIWGSLDYEPYRGEAIVLEGEPGDLLSWPSNYWHVAESCDSFPITLSVAHDGEPQAGLTDPFRQVERLLNERLRTSSGAMYYSYNLRERQENANNLTQVMASTTQVLRNLSRDKQLEQLLRVSWLNRLTGFGFDFVPPPMAHEPLADDLVVSGDPRYPIMWLTAEDNEIVCSANGHAFSLAAHPHVLKMLERLNSGAACRIGDLVTEYKGTAKRGRVEAACKEIRAILEKLYSLRAITLEPVRGRSNKDSPLELLT